MTRRVPHQSRLRPAGFTLVEILIVVTILGLLAAILLPTIPAMKRSASETSLKQILVQIRIAIHRYSFSHKGIYPSQVTDGVAAPGTVECLLRQLQMRTNSDGFVLSRSSKQRGCGPFLHTLIPHCPVGNLQNKNSVNIVSDYGKIQADTNPQHAWKYNSHTGEFICNSNLLCADGSSPYWWW
ncbi:MAG: prepilin-type N-terminal cleavage/methylation domain-containing protein [Planctomycetaceae bacterium]